MRTFILQNRTRLFGLSVLLTLGIVLLAACADVGSLTALSDPVSISQLDAPQPAASGEWDAAVFFAGTCANCHGADGGGTAIAPSLNREEIQNADTDWLIETISNGRAGTAMPAWSVESGGSLYSEQIAEMAVFLQTGDWDAVGEMAGNGSNNPMGYGGMGNGGMMGGGMMGGGMMGGSN